MMALRASSSPRKACACKGASIDAIAIPLAISWNEKRFIEWVMLINGR